MKAVATEPSDRYQSAEAMAHDLQSFLEDRPILARRVPPIERFVRWSRRNRAVAALSATVAVLLVLVSVVASIGFVRENRERLKAQTTSHLAVGALENIYSQFAPAPLQTPGEESIEGEDGDTLLAAQPQLPLSKDVARLLENLLDFYDQLSTEAGDDPSVLVKSIMASRRVGDIHHRLGELDKATAAYERAIRRYESAKDRLSSDVDANLELARIHNGMGLVQSMSQSHGAAARSHQLAVDIVREQTDDEESRLELARTYYLLDMASEGMRRQRRNRPDGNGKPNRGQSSCDHLSKAVAILEHSMDNLAEQPEHAFLLARCYLTIAERLGRESPSDSHEHYETAVRLLEQLVAAYPDVPDYRCELGDAYARPVYYRLWRKRDAERSLSDLADSESRLRKALEVTSDLELDHPNIPRYLAFKSRLHQTLGCVLRDADNPEEARRHFQDAIQNQNLIVRLDPNNSWNLVHRARLQLDQAGVLTELHELDQAFSVARAAVNRLESLPLDDSNQDRFLHFMCQRNVWDGYRQLEQIAMLQGRPLEPEFQARLDEMRDRMPPDPERRGR